ncbi:unnamed protein product [Musa hybrid cultivar]
MREWRWSNGIFLEFKEVEGVGLAFKASNGEDKERDKGAEWQWGSKGGGMGLGKRSDLQGIGV